MMSISDAAEQLGVTIQMIYKYIDRGMETITENKEQKIPQSVLDAWKNPEIALQLQWDYQLQNQTLDQKLNIINKQIIQFEQEYGGTFHHLYGNLSGHDIDGLEDSVDVSDWKNLMEEKQLLLKQKFANP